jgi:hypothetical protein
VRFETMDEPRRGGGRRNTGARTRDRGDKLTQKGFIRFLVPAPGAKPEDLKILLPAAPKQDRAMPDELAEEFAKIDADVVRAKSAMDPIAASAEGKAALDEILLAVDLFRGLKSRIRRDKNGQVVTNAWLKIYEIATQLGLVEYTTADPVTMFGNAELPGAFVCAMNQYARTVAAVGFEWTASSLYPDASAVDAEHGDILGDQYGLYECNRDRWMMEPPCAAPSDADGLTGEVPGQVPAPEPLSAAIVPKFCNNGDVTVVANVVDLTERVQARLDVPGVALYTADAGIDASKDFARQEELNMHIHYGQTVSGLLTLASGGCFVVKHYTFTQHFTISLIVSLSYLFAELYIVKPSTSRPTNSETYFVGKGFKGLAKAQREALLSRLGSFDADTPLVPLGAPGVQDTLAVIFRAARQIHQRQQVAFLDEVIAFHGDFGGSDQKLSELKRALNRTARDVQDNWLRHNPVYAISSAQQIAQRVGSDSGTSGKCGKPADH